MVVRYDRRGVGQSGGRIETVTLQDYADDVVAIVKWLARRDDVDPRRIAVAGTVKAARSPMLAAARESKIASLVLVASSGSSGADLVLEQQQHQLDVMKLPDAERQQKIDLQQKVHAAVLTDKGWEASAAGGPPPGGHRMVPQRAAVRSRPDHAEDRQPLLIVQGDLDTQVPPHHAEQLAELARKRKKPAPVEAVHLPGVNHLLAKATTGEVRRSPAESARQATITPDAASAIAEWLQESPMKGRRSTRLCADENRCPERDAARVKRGSR